MALNSIRTSIIAATVALTALTSGGAFAGTPPQQTSTDVQPTVLSTKLVLTKDQQQKIQAIRADRIKKIDAVLTAEQRAKLAAAKDDQSLKTALGTLNLSKDQKTKIADIVKKSNESIKGTLTQKQLQQLATSSSMMKK